MLTVVLGGARSGKSRYAQRLCGGGPVLYIATARRDDDPELAERIERHRASRPASWTTIEEPLRVVDAVRAAPLDRTVILDCATVWLSNVMWACRSLSVGDIETRVAEMADSLADLARRRELIVVSNEVGSGIVPMDAVARRFRDLHGLMNQRLAAAADRVILMVAGIPLPLHA